MRYNGIFGIILVIVMIVAILKSSLNIILLSTINNEDINIKLNIKYLFNMINVKIQLYPLKKKEKEKENNTKKEKKGEKIKLSKEDINNAYYQLKKIKVEEIYSNIKFGNENIHFTCFIYVFINTIYGNLINITKPKKLYLNIVPDFTDNYINLNVKIHLKLAIKDIINMLIFVVKTYIKNKKEDVDNESAGVNKKSYGDNS
ncbi:MAG: DUF2953 domain-containing protein [Peptostreptococcaceae bacterium]